MNKNKPLYRISLGNNKGYYSPDICWKGCTKEEAHLFIHKEAVLIANKLSSMHYHASIELVEKG